MKDNKKAIGWCKTINIEKIIEALPEINNRYNKAVGEDYTGHEYPFSVNYNTQSHWEIKFRGEIFINADFKTSKELEQERKNTRDIADDLLTIFNYITRQRLYKPEIEQQNSWQFYMPEQKEAKNPSNKFIHKKMKKMGIKEYLIRKHVHILVNEFDNLSFNENDIFEQAVKKALMKSKGGCIIYLRTK